MLYTVEDIYSAAVARGYSGECDGTMEDALAALESVQPPKPLDPAEVLTAIFAAEPENLDILPDETLSRMAPYMQEWESGTAYSIGDIRSHADFPYRCVQAHTSQDDWTPDVAVSLWARIGDPGEEWPEWIQPTGAHDAYAKDAKVSHDGGHWISDIDANVYEPGVYGWTEAA